MDVILSILLLAIQHAKCTGETTQNYEVLQPNVIVTNVNLAGQDTVVQVPLHCGEPGQHGEVTWKNNGVQLPQRGNDISIIVEEMIGGNYSCHDGQGSLLNHTLVLVRSPGRKILSVYPDTGHIKCSAKNYNGSFQCSWTWSPGRKGEVVYVNAIRMSERSSTTCVMNSNQLSVTCWDQSFCPYAEESDRILLELGVRHVYRLEEYSLSFFLSEIVKPDKVQFMKLGRDRVVLEYPESWSLPHSYFPLTFEVKEVPQRKDCSCQSGCRSNRAVKVNISEERQLTVRKGFITCVRAKDALCDSSWGDWNQFMNKIRRAKSHAIRNQH